MASVKRDIVKERVSTQQQSREELPLESGERLYRKHMSDTDPVERGQELLTLIRQRAKSREHYYALFTSFIIIASFYMLFQGQREVHEPWTPGKQIRVTSLSGEERKVLLPDGSSLLLAPGSSIGYPPKMRKEQREVALYEGEVSFDVRSHDNLPFVVYSKNLRVNARSGSFIVKAYLDQKEERVVVLNGKVSVSADNKLLLHPLSKGTGLSFNKNSRRAFLISLLR